MENRISKASKEIYAELSLNIRNQKWGPYEVLFFLDYHFHNYYVDLMDQKLGTIRFRF